MNKQTVNKYSPEQIFGMAMAAHRINGAYLKENEYDIVDVLGYQEHRLRREANKIMIKRWVQSNDLAAVTEEDREKGAVIRNHFRGYMFLAIAGKLNDFQQQAYKISEKAEFSQYDSLELAIAASLPSIYERDRARKEFMEQLRASTQIRGAVGERVEGEITVLDSRFSLNYCKYRVQAKLGQSFVDFWYPTALAAGTTVKIRGKIKVHRDDRSTQLNYVKILG